MDIEWIYAICPYCDESYPYPKGDYKPKTCGKFNCVQEHHFNSTRTTGAINRMLDNIEKEELNGSDRKRD